MTSYTSWLWSSTSWNTSSSQVSHCYTTSWWQHITWYFAHKTIHATCQQKEAGQYCVYNWFDDTNKTAKLINSLFYNFHSCWCVEVPSWSWVSDLHLSFLSQKSVWRELSTQVADWNSEIQTSLLEILKWSCLYDCVLSDIRTAVSHQLASLVKLKGWQLLVRKC